MSIGPHPGDLDDEKQSVISLLLIASSLSVFGGNEETTPTPRDDSWTGFYLGGKIGYGAISNGNGTYMVHRQETGQSHRRW